MVKDHNKGITHIDYNYLNLPERVELSTGTVIHYEYDALGVKHRKVVDDGSPDTTHYAGPFHYTNGTLQFVQHAEGRALESGSHWTYEYHLTDHLGNVRVTIDEHGSVVQRQDYYPFGGVFNHYSSGTENLYKLTGNEEQKEWSVFDFNARMYDSWLGRFNSIDPLADTEQESWNPYHFNYNNLIAYVDPTGLFSTHTDSTGNVIAVYDDGDLGVYRHDDATTKEDVDQKRADSATTSGDGEKMGETEYWDDFVYESTGDVVNEYGVGFRIMFGESWDSQISDLANQAQGMDIVQIAMKSRNNGVFSIQDQQPGVGKMLNGKYVSSKSAGNYLAGLNASMKHLDFDTFQRLAGASHSLNHSNPPKELTEGRMLYVYFGGSYGPAPMYGETQQQYRWSRRGYDAGVSYRRFAPRGVR